MPRLTLESDPPLTTADPLVATAVTDAVTRYLAGDYTGAANRLLDARPLVSARADGAPWESFLATLEFALVSRAIVNAPPHVVSDARGAQ